MMGNINKSRKYLLEFFKQKSKNLDSDWITSHVEKVVEYSGSLARSKKLDIEICKISAYLHDLGRAIEDSQKDHVANSLKYAEIFLEKIKYPQEKKVIVLRSIANHSGKSNKKRDIYSQVLADADALAHFDTIEDVFYVGMKFNPNWNRDRLRKEVLEKYKRSWKKLSSSSKLIAREKYNAILLLLK